MADETGMTSISRMGSDLHLEGPFRKGEMNQDIDSHRWEVDNPRPAASSHHLVVGPVGNIMIVCC